MTRSAKPRDLGDGNLVESHHTEAWLEMTAVVCGIGTARSAPTLLHVTESALVAK